MPMIDLSTLNGPELRRLLDSARRQGQAAQSYEILREMEARRQRGTRPRSLSRKRGAPPRVISMVVEDPLDPKEEPLEDVVVDEIPPMRLQEDDPPEEVPPQPAPAVAKSQGWAHWGALIFAVGLAGGVAGGWWAANFANGRAPGLPGSPARSTAPAAIQTAGLAPVPPANAEPANGETPVTLVPEATPVATEVPPASPPQAQPDTASAAPSPPPAPVTPAPEPVEPAQEAPSPQSAHPAPSAPAAATPAEASPAEVIPAPKPVHSASADKGCASQPTPADRTICADPKLRRLQTELREAYADALKAHQDRTLLRQRELAWADARNGVTDPARLAVLYRQRIDKLKAATVDALKHRPASVTRAAADPGP